MSRAGPAGLGQQDGVVGLPEAAVERHALPASRPRMIAKDSSKRDTRRS
jgi:hypothetical protein